MGRKPSGVARQQVSRVAQGDQRKGDPGLPPLRAGAQGCQQLRFGEICGGRVRRAHRSFHSALKLNGLSACATELRTLLGCAKVAAAAIPA